MSSPSNNAWNHMTQHDSSTDPDENQSSSTPPRPSYSPVTPTIPPAVLAPPSPSQRHHHYHSQQQQHGQRGGEQRQDISWMNSPPPAEPISLDENPDAIALRAAISILQMQRQQSLQDIKTLDKMKTTALAHPESFLHELKEGKYSSTSSSRDTVKDESAKDGEQEGDDGDAMTNGNEPSKSRSSTTSLGPMPEAQDVVRAPPINWAKYHVIGESLDRLHEQQRRRPSSGHADDVDMDGRTREHVVAAPYNPLVDRVPPNDVSRHEGHG